LAKDFLDDSIAGFCFSLAWQVILNFSFTRRLKLSVWLTARLPAVVLVFFTIAALPLSAIDR